MSETTLAYVYFTDFSPHQANAIQTIHTTNALTELGYTIDLFTYGDIQQFAEQNGVAIESAIHRCPIRIGHETIDRILYYTYTLRKSRGHDVIFTRDISLLRFLHLWPWSLPQPLVYEAHKSYSGMGEMSAEDERERLRHADVVFTQSNGVKADLEALGIDVEAVVPNAASDAYVPEEFPTDLAEQLDLNDDINVVVYAGSLSPKKNDIKLLIQAVADLDCENTRLLLVGGSPNRIEELNRWMNRSGIDSDLVHFVGRVPHAEVFRYLALGDVGVIPLKEDNPEARKYTSPIKFFEYLISDMNVVAADVPAVEPIASEKVFMYPPDDGEKLVSTILKAVTTDIAENCSKYSYSHRSKHIAELLDSSMK